VVAASGNEGEAGSPVTDPGVCIGVVAVGAVDSADQVAPFSSRHPYLTVTAPGVEIPTLGRVSGEAYIGAGTSQATAIVSAGLALIWSKYPDLTNHQVVARMLATLERRVTTPTADPAYGFGILDVGAAIDTAVPADAANPVLAAATPFLDRSVADAAVLETPPTPVEIVEAVPGEVVIGARPTDLTSDVIRGLGLAALGLLALLVLLVIGVVRRRRYLHAARMATPPGGPDSARATTQGA
jgi:subtilisin family serine protease